jgi:drug/metabolite transporter (DMT)-like permease
VIGVLLATVTACTWGSISVLEARVSRAIGGPSTLAWIFGVGLLVVAPVALIHGLPDASAGAWAWAALAAAGSLAGLALLFTALQWGRVGLVSATISSQGAFAAIYAAFAGESLHPLSLVAIGVSAAGTYVLIGSDGGSVAPIHERRGILLALAAACFTGASLFAASRGGDGIGADWVVLCVRAASVGAVLVPLAATRRLRDPRPVLWPMLVSAVGEVAAFAAYIAASDRIGVAVPAVIASQFALIAAAVGWVVLGERLGGRQLAGAGAILAGVTALTIVQA